ncbi:iron-containing alcohol dehydrogenase family protein [Candidatus Formimonas warabiya]|nr:iron-containing alcohol dehydrogenase [Candidatus Formimonas warabiya]
MEMPVWKMHTPQGIFHGRGSIRSLKTVVEDEKIARPFLVLDPAVEKTGFGGEIKNILENVQSFYWTGFTSDPTLTQVERGAVAFREVDADGLIAVGGGSAIDAAKMIAQKTGFPLLAAVPTTCGTGAECSPVAMIKDEKKVKKIAFRDPRFIPKWVILDAEGLTSLDRAFVAATALDTLSHVMETHLSQKSTGLVRVSTRGSLVSLGKNLAPAIFDQDPGALEVLLDVAFTARLLYPGTGLSIIHALAHPLGAYTGLHHGMAVALLTPPSLEFNLPFCGELMREIDDLLNVKSQQAKGTGAWVHRIVAESGMGTHIEQKLKKEEVPLDKIVNQAMESSNLPSNPRPVCGPKDLREVLERACACRHIF